MMSPNEQKALAWYCLANNLKPQMSTHPIYRFIDSQGIEIKRNIFNLVIEYKRNRPPGS